MPYDDDDDLFGHEFDFVDDDEDEGESAKSRESADDEDAPTPKSRRRPAARGKADKPAAERPKGRGKAPATGGARRPSRPPADEPIEQERDEAPPLDDEPIEEEVSQEQPTPEPVGPPADHVVHIYEYGTLKRTIPRKFTDEEAVSFAEEYTRTGKAYGRYAVATPEDEEPAPTFAGASRGS
jgi:hypothetical protein